MGIAVFPVDPPPQDSQTLREHRSPHTVALWGWGTNGEETIVIGTLWHKKRDLDTTNLSFCAHLLPHTTTPRAVCLPQCQQPRTDQSYHTFDFLKVWGESMTAWIESAKQLPVMTVLLQWCGSLVRIRLKCRSLSRLLWPPPVPSNDFPCNEFLSTRLRIIFITQKYVPNLHVHVHLPLLGTVLFPVTYVFRCTHGKVVRDKKIENFQRLSRAQRGECR